MKVNHRKKHDNRVVRKKLNPIEVLISKALFDTYINLNKIFCMNVLRECNKMKEEIINPENTVKYTI